LPTAAYASAKASAYKVMPSLTLWHTRFFDHLNEVKVVEKVGALCHLTPNAKHSLFNSTTLIKLLLAILLIPIGLLTKVYLGIGSEFVTNYLGGVIYVVFFIMLASLVLPQANPLIISLIVLSLTCLIEVSQLIQNDILKNLRTHFLIRSLIGSVFNVFDFIYYFVGGLIGYAILEGLINRSQNDEKYSLE
jgi:hypothetical protein